MARNVTCLVPWAQILLNIQLTLHAEEKREELKRQIDKCEEATEVLKVAGDRFFGMDNRASKEEMEHQIKDLLDVMMVCDKITPS